MQDIGSVSASPQRFLSPALPLQRMKAREVEGRKQTSATAWVRTSVISSTRATDPGQAGIGIAPQMTDMHVSALLLFAAINGVQLVFTPLVAKHTFSPEAAIGAPSSTLLRPSHLPVIRSGLTFAITRRGHNGVLCGRLVAPPRVSVRVYSRHSGETLPPATGGLHAVTRHMISQLDTRHPYSTKFTYFLHWGVFSRIGKSCWF